MVNSMNPRIILVLLFIGFPLLELYILIKIGGSIGAIYTIFVIVFTGVLGSLLLRQQGLRSMAKVRQSIERGEVPALAMFESLCVFVAAILLIIPGFMTDAIGLFFLIAPIRRWLVSKILGLSRFKPPANPRPGPSTPLGGNAKKPIDGEYTREDE